MVNFQKIQQLAQGGSFDAENLVGIDQKKLRALGRGTAYDTCASTSSKRIADPKGIGTVLKSGICHAYTPDGRCVSLFKTLFTNACTHQCNYCPNSASCKKKSQPFFYKPEELANLTLSLYQSNYIEGLFLSSGIAKDEDSTMEKMLDSIKILRRVHNFQGYIHLKILPGTNNEYIKQALELSDRVSINIEASSKSRLSEMSPTKEYKNDILQKQKVIKDILNKKENGAGHTTQMILGSTDENDKEVFSRLLNEYTQYKVKRVYYSAFSPICGTTFENRQAQSLWREKRLYQIDWLYRVYKFNPRWIDYAFNENGFLQNQDPKKALAQNLLDRPLNPQTSSYSELLLIPGIGPTSAQRIISARKTQKLDSKKKLQTLGVVLKRALPFLKINGFVQTSLNGWQSI
jgi:putative DNA modification/repair radical SAM protein